MRILFAEDEKDLNRIIKRKLKDDDPDDVDDRDDDLDDDDDVDDRDDD